MLPSRRQVLAAAGVLTAEACTASRSRRAATPSALDTARARAVQREQSLVDLYAQALQAHPELTPLLSAVRADHAAHLAALRPPATPTPLASTPVATPPTTRVTRQSLRAAERAAAAAHAQDAASLGAGCDADLVPLLASLAACESSHAALL